MFKKIILIVFGIFFMINEGLAQFAPPQNPAIEKEAFVGDTVPLTYNLRRTISSDVVSRLRDQDRNFPGTEVLGGTCLTAGILDCTVILTYTPALRAVGKESGSFRLIVNNTVLYPASGVLSFTINIIAPPSIITVQSFATDEPSGPAEGQTGVRIIGSGFNYLPDGFKVNFVYGSSAAEATEISRESDTAITLNTPRFPGTFPGRLTPVDVVITNAAGRELTKRQNGYLYRNANCTPNESDPSECVARLKPCIYVAGPPSSQDRYINISAQKPDENRCVDSYSKFEPIKINANLSNMTFCTEQSYRLVADRESSALCRAQPTTIPQRTELDLSYSRLDNPSEKDTVRLWMSTFNNQFSVTAPLSQYCVTNHLAGDYPLSCDDRRFTQAPNTPLVISNFTNNQEILVLNSTR